MRDGHMAQREPCIQIKKKGKERIKRKKNKEKERRRRTVCLRGGRKRILEREALAFL